MACSHNPTSVCLSPSAINIVIPLFCNMWDSPCCSMFLRVGETQWRTSPFDASSPCNVVWLECLSTTIFDKHPRLLSSTSNAWRKQTVFWALMGIKNTFLVTSSMDTTIQILVKPFLLQRYMAPVSSIWTQLSGLVSSVWFKKSSDCFNQRA